MNNYNQQGPLGENEGWITKVVSIEDLRPHPTFIDWHMLDQLKVDEQAEQFAKFGQHACGAILVDPLNRVLDGYHAWAALRKRHVPEVWVTVVDLPDDQLEELVTLRHKNRHHYTDKHLMHWIMTKYVGFARGQKPNGKPFPSALPSEPGMDLNQDPRRTHEHIAGMFHSNTTTVKQAIGLKRSGDRYLINEVLIGSKTINGAHKVANPPDKGDVKGLGWKPKHPIPVGDNEIAAFTKEAAEVGLSVEAMLAGCIRARITHPEATTAVPLEPTKQIENPDKSHSATRGTEPPQSPTINATTAAQPSADQSAATKNLSTEDTSIPVNLDATPAPVLTMTSTPVTTPDELGTTSDALVAKDGAYEKGLGRRGIVHWDLKKIIAVLELKRDGIADDAIAQMIGPNSEGNLVSAKAIEHLVRHYKLPNKQFPTKEDRDKYDKVIKTLKAKLVAGATS